MDKTDRLLTKKEIAETCHVTEVFIDTYFPVFIKNLCLAQLAKADQASQPTKDDELKITLLTEGLRGVLFKLGLVGSGDKLTPKDLLKIAGEYSSSRKEIAEVLNRIRTIKNPCSRNQE